jgi:hypothetical protein
MSEWECYCDEWYYHLWRVRRKHERGFDHGYHVQNKDEAEGLRDLLNQFERELAEAREHAEQLAEALDRILAYEGRFGEDGPDSIAADALAAYRTGKGGA